MIAWIVIIIWVVFFLSFLNGKKHEAHEEIASKTSMYNGILNLSTVDHVGKTTEEIPLRLRVHETPSVLTGLRVTSMSVQLTEEDGQKIGWYMDGTNTESSGMWRGHTTPKLFPRFDKDCEVNLEIHTSSMVEAGEVHFQNSPKFKGKLYSQNCKFQGDFSVSVVDWEHVSRKASRWSMMLNICTILEIRAFVSQASAERLIQVSVHSIWMIALCAIIEAGVIISLGISYALEFNTFSITSLFKFLTFTLLHISYMESLWKCRLPRDAEGNVDNRVITRMYLRFYIVALVTLMLVARFWSYFPVLLLLSQCSLAPQIVYDVFHGYKHSTTLAFTVLITMSKLIPALYLYGCPYTIFNGDPLPRIPGNDGHGNAWMTLLLVTVALGLLGLSVSQRYFGPRWFTPMICLPHVYNYIRVVNLDEGRECAICMMEIQKAAKTEDLCVTPCDHVFHKDCLTQWSEIKMECPTCRSELPPLE